MIQINVAAGGPLRIALRNYSLLNRNKGNPNSRGNDEIFIIPGAGFLCQVNHSNWVNKMSQKNCWQSKACGREIGGAHVVEYGVCPAATDREAHGLNGGTNGGRICWAVSGTFCGGKIQGTFANKRLNCMTCDFYLATKAEQGKDFMLLMPGQKFEVAHH